MWWYSLLVFKSNSHWSLFILVELYIALVRIYTNKCVFLFTVPLSLPFLIPWTLTWSCLPFIKSCETAPPQQHPASCPRYPSQRGKWSCLATVSWSCGSNCVNYQNIEEMIPIFTCFKAPSRLQQSELTQCKYSSLSLMQLRPDDVWPVLVQGKVFLALSVLFLLQSFLLTSCD